MLLTNGPCGFLDLPENCFVVCFNVTSFLLKDSETGGFELNTSNFNTFYPSNK